MRNPFVYIEKIVAFGREYFSDMWLFMKHNNHSPFEEKNKKAYFQTIILSHTIEKGLSLSKPRPMFGRDKVSSILAQLRSYKKSFSLFPVEMANGALSAYREFNSVHAAKDDATISAIDLHLFNDQGGCQLTGGVKVVDAGSRIDSELSSQFLRSRTSCRMFSSEALGVDEVSRVLELAQSAPSQCNRQSVRVHFYQDREKISRLLKLQGGSAGFSDDVGNLFVVTSEITAWGGPQQRNQLYVDGGLYSMMLMLACHSEGIASCPLNLAVMNSVEKEIKDVGSIPNSQRLIMMIAVGKAASGSYKAANSPRCSLTEIAKFH